jgi:hypothetical protein
MTVTHPREFPDTILTECTVTLDEGLVMARHSRGRAGTISQIAQPNWTARINTGGMGPQRRATWESWRNSLGGRPFLAWDTSLPEPLAYMNGHPAIIAGTWNGTGTIASMTADTIALAGVPANFVAHVGGRVGLVQNGRYGYYSIISSTWGGPAIAPLTGATVAASAVPGPNGTLQASELVEDTSNGRHETQFLALTVASGGAATLSMFVHPASTRVVQLQAFNNTDAIGGRFNPATGQFLSAGSGAGFVARGAELLSNGWWRIWLTASATSAGSMRARVNLMNAAGAQSYVGDGTSRAILWGQQFTLGADGAAGTGMTVQVAPLINPPGTPIFTTAASVVLRRPRLAMQMRPGSWAMAVDSFTPSASFDADQVL